MPTKPTVIVMLIALVLLGSAPAAMAQQTPTGYWQAEYFANANLEGAPALVRQEAELDADFGYGSPAPGLPVDGFSVRWTRYMWFDQGGTYEFGAQTDDGVRLWVDGYQIINNWGPRQGEWSLGQIYLNPGVHNIRMEYFDLVGWAKASLGWRLLAGTGSWQGQYYANRNLSGDPVLARDDARIAFEWEDGSPDALVPANDFSVRWKRSVYFPTGTFLFRAHTDDGVRVWVGGNLIIDAWVEQLRTTRDYTMSLNAGMYDIQVEYFDHLGGAAAHFWWETLYVDPGYVNAYVISGESSGATGSTTTTSDTGSTGTGVQAPAGAWTGSYYAGTDLSQLLFTREDSALNFDWGQNPPVYGMDENYFSARWTRDVPLERGTWRVHVEVDDGARVWVNNQRLIDQWAISDVSHYTADFPVWSASEVPVKVEYFEEVGEARISVWFEQIDATPHN